MFANAKDVDQYYREHIAKGEKFSDASKKLRLVDVAWGLFGDWWLYVDEDGNRWQEYLKRGD